jgi:hypothetical protein
MKLTATASRITLLLLLSASAALTAQTTLERPAPGHLVVVYRNNQIPTNANAILALARARATHHLPLFGMSAIQVASADEPAARASLAAQPQVLTVLQDRIVSAHMLMTRPQLPPTIVPPAPVEPRPILPLPVRPPTGLGGLSPLVSTADLYYNGPQGWAVIQSGGYGDNIPGGPATGPWNQSRGAGVRIAVLDSGVDEHHPDLAPNLALNLSEVDQTATTGVPSPCDDGSPQDQQGHGTWTASLSTAALGNGETVGVAPQATLLNIKVLQRTPAAISGTIAQQCEVGQATGLLSWVLQGIQDAVTNHADIIQLSLGTLVDITTGDGAGWQAQFNRVTYAAAQAGSVLVAALGNDGLDLSANGPNPQYLELPAQSRSVLAVTASTNPACAENLATNATCAAGPVKRPYYSNHSSTLAVLAAPGGSYPEGADTAISGYVRGACSSGLPNTTDGLPGTGSQSFGCFGLGHTAYVQAFGTSASAALVAGAAALLHAARPNLSAAQIVSTLQASATTTPSMAEPQLNLAAALAYQP